jgi:hypothetical protein
MIIKLDPTRLYTIRYVDLQTDEYNKRCNMFVEGRQGGGQARAPALQPRRGPAGGPFRRGPKEVGHQESATLGHKIFSWRGQVFVTYLIQQT